MKQHGNKKLFVPQFVFDSKWKMSEKEKLAPIFLLLSILIEIRLLFRRPGFFQLNFKTSSGPLSRWADFDELVKPVK